MHADITRDTFDPARHFSRVLMQQGRVPLDADLNEQSSILLHYLRTLAADLIGPYAGPRNNLGFGIGYTTQNGGTLQVGPGRYYVNGLLCENEGTQSIPVNQSESTDGARSPAADEKAYVQPLRPPFLAYLEVWEQLVTAYHQPLLRETALGGPDTAARTQVMWRVRTEQLQPGQSACETVWPEIENRLRGGWERGELAVRTSTATDTLDPCILPPDARYRGMENQLYRVEIHSAGRLGEGGAPPTFKWSRENGSVVFAIRSLNGDVAEVETLGLDPRLDLAPGDWVEITDDERAASGRGMLAQVVDVDRDGLRVVLEHTADDYPEYNESDAGIHPLLRRWDQSEPVIVRGDGAAQTGTIEKGAVKMVEGWIELESGIQVRFEPYRPYLAGDYWLIPARVATGDVEWPLPPNDTELARVVARRTERYYAPLGVVIDQSNVTDCRRCIGEIVGPCYQIK